jgi:succinate---hydroxymethylglutarate CoA-transferase
MPVVFDGLTRSVRRPPPTLGQHTVEILRELGHDARHIDALLQAGAIQVSSD